VKKGFWIRKVDKSINTEVEMIISSTEKKIVNKIMDEGSFRFTSDDVENEETQDILSLQANLETQNKMIKDAEINVSFY
jgi:hypothetical protein